MKLIVVFLAAISISIGVSAQEKRDLLTRDMSPEKLELVLDKGSNWLQLPDYADRAGWAKIPAEVRKIYIARGQKSMGAKWEIIPATSYIEFTKSGDRQAMEAPLNKRMADLNNLVLAELMEGRGRFIDDIVNGVWAICEQSTWVGSAHLPAQKGGAGLPNPDDTIVDLMSARMASTMSIIYHFFNKEFDKVSPYISPRIRAEVRDRVILPYYNRDNFFWQGLRGGIVNNWNTYCNYFVLNSILLTEDNPALRAKYVWKVMRSLDAFLNCYPADGGCDEGPSYWTMAGGKLFESLDILSRATDGKVNIMDNQLVGNIGRYVCSAYIGNDYVVPFADARISMRYDPAVLFRFGKAISDSALMQFGAWSAQTYNSDGQFSGTIESVLVDLTYFDQMISHKAAEPSVSQVWLPDTQLAMARAYPGSKSGLYFSAKGGHNKESHNHNDVGSFVLYFDSKPLFIDAGVGTYTRQTFSKERYAIWNMRSAYHNLPIINGVEQQNGRAFAATDPQFSVRGKSVNSSVDIAKAYPDSAAVNHWRRSYKLTKGSNRFEITDSWDLRRSGGNSSLVMMTPYKVTPSSNGADLNGDGFTAKLHYDTRLLNIRVEEVELTDPRMLEAWKGSIYRLVFEIKSTALRGTNTILIDVQ